MEKSLKKLSHLSTAVEASSDAIISTDLDHRLVSWNKGAETLYGFSADQALGKGLEIIVPEESLALMRDLLHQVGTSHQVISGRRSTHQTSDGFLISVDLQLAPIVEDGQVVGTSLTVKDASERERVEEQLEYMTDHDSLTGLHNRRYFTNMLERELHPGGDGPDTGAMLLLDVDNFKLVNDSYTHETGDNILRSISRALRQIIDDGDHLAHFGGDEFAVLLPGADVQTASDFAIDTLQTLRSDLWEQFRLGITLSAGICSYSASSRKKPEELIIASDMALFEAKENGKGKNSVSGYDNAEATRFNWAEKVRHALDTGLLVLYAQPIMEVSSGKIVQQELLLRMKDPDAGVIAPAPFLAVAERLGLIGEIDRWVVRQGLAFAGQGEAVEINLSGDSMTDPEMLALIETEIRRNAVDPKKVAFEITETTAIANLEEATEFAGQVNALGCQFALDDFGTGFGSFIYLKHLPVSILKIDGEFIRNLPASEVDQSIVKAIVSIADTMGKKIVAEWVGDEETLALLREYGVAYAQGYHVGKPQPCQFDR